MRRVRLAVTAVIAVLTISVAGAALLNSSGDTLPVADTEAERYVTVTFDDAYASQYRTADALESRGMRGVYFVPVGQLNGTFEGIPTMQQRDMVDLADRGHEIGGHTYNHTNLSQVSEQEFRDSIRRNRAALQEMGEEPVSFAYPYGGMQHTDVVREEYRYGRGIGWQANKVPVSDSARVHSIALTEENADVLDAYLDRLQPGEWLVISLHHVDSTGEVDRPQIDVSEQTYTEILDSIEAADVETVTFQEMAER